MPHDNVNYNRDNYETILETNCSRGQCHRSDTDVQRDHFNFRIIRTPGGRDIVIVDIFHCSHSTMSTRSEICHSTKVLLSYSAYCLQENSYFHQFLNRCTIPHRVGPSPKLPTKFTWYIFQDIRVSTIINKTQIDGADWSVCTDTLTQRLPIFVYIFFCLFRCRYKGVVLRSAHVPSVVRGFHREGRGYVGDLCERANKVVGSGCRKVRLQHLGFSL